MKKFSSILLALAMLIALCVPAFAADEADFSDNGILVVTEEEITLDSEDNSDSTAESTEPSTSAENNLPVVDDSNLGISTFDPSGVLDNVADGISDNDLSGLFGTLRNTINDLSGRLSGVFNNIGGGNNGGGDDSNNNSSNGDNSFGGSEPTGDTAIYAVAGVAAVAAAALIFTRKKSEKAE